MKLLSTLHSCHKPLLLQGTELLWVKGKPTMLSSIDFAERHFHCLTVILKFGEGEDRKTFMLGMYLKILLVWNWSAGWLLFIFESTIL